MTPPDEESRPDEYVPLLRDDRARHLAPRGENTPPAPAAVPASIARRLYVSHFLSTWNSRVFEFGAILYLAAVYPGTLLPMSVYAFARGAAAIVFAPLVGQYIDAGDRLQVVRVSIVGQRLVVAASCAVFYLLATGIHAAQAAQTVTLALLAFLACIEKLCSVMNLVSVEKDWVVVVAESDPAALRALNAQMRRIDLMCKLVGPLAIALVDGYSTRIAILVNLGMNLASVLIEYFAVARVYYQVDRLREPKKRLGSTAATSTSTDGPDPEIAFIRIAYPLARVLAIFQRSAADFGLYIRHTAFLPSIAGALLYLTVLSFSGQMVTFLLSSGYNSMQVGVARTAAVVFEVLATWLAPWLMGLIGPIRAGLWLGSWQVVTLIAGTAVFVACADSPLISASGIVAGTILSRLGLRGFDMCIQVIVQEDVGGDIRGAFSTVEAAWQNAFELLSYAATIVFFRPEKFMWPALISVGAVTLAICCYTWFVYNSRGHLFHLEKLASICDTRSRRRNILEC